MTHKLKISAGWLGLCLLGSIAPEATTAQDASLLNGTPGRAGTLPVASRVALEDHTPRPHMFADPDWFQWGGSVMQDAGGRYHMFYSRWRRENPRGMRGWLYESQIAHAVADRPEGPFIAQESLLFPADVRAEDPCVWVEGDWIFAAVKDWNGDLSGTTGISYVRGRLDGDVIRWEVPENNNISPRLLHWDDGQQTPLHHLERPFVLRDEAGVPTHLFAAARVGNPFEGDHQSGASLRLPFNVSIPLMPAGQ